MNKDTFNRRLKMLERLKTGRRITSAEFGLDYDVTKKTILHDMSFLSEYSITSKAGPGGGFWYTGEPEVTMPIRVYMTLRDFTKDRESELSQEILFELRKIDKNIEP